MGLPVLQTLLLRSQRRNPHSPDHGTADLRVQAYSARAGTGGLILALLLVLTVLVGCDGPGSATQVRTQHFSRSVSTSTPVPARSPSSSLQTPENPTLVPSASRTRPTTPLITAAGTLEPTATSEATSYPVSSPTVPATSTTAAVPTHTSTASPSPTTTAVPVFTPGGEVTGIAPGRGEVALLFNADAFPGEITRILDTLRAHSTHLTFFLTGTYLDTFPGQARAIAAAGQEIASHGYDHRDYRGLTNGQIVSRLDHWQETFKRLTGKMGPAFWMAPSGDSDSRVRQAAQDHGYTTIYWTLDSLDAVGAPKSRSFVLDRVLQTSWVNLDGAIILMHVNSVGTVDALPEILSTLEARGLRAVTVSELLCR
jgi:peptidoglycan/xylan/chitin deacetylase (PgdA/CDA1 family)